MKTVGIVPNYDKEAAMNLVGELAQFLREKDCKVVLTYKIAEVTGLKELGVTKYELFSKDFSLYFQVQYCMLYEIQRYESSTQF